MTLQDAKRLIYSTIKSKTSTVSASYKVAEFTGGSFNVNIDAKIEVSTGVFAYLTFNATQYGKLSIKGIGPDGSTFTIRIINNNSIYIQKTGMQSIEVSKELISGALANPAVVAADVPTTPTSDLTTTFTVNSSGTVTINTDVLNVTGSITLPNSSIITNMINDKAVTNAKLANMSARRIKGNNTTSEGPALDLTVEEARDLLLNDVLVSGNNTMTNTKITYDKKGLIVSSTSLVPGDIPALDSSKITTGTFPVARGGTGINTYSVGDILYASSASELSPLSKGSVGTVLKATSNGIGWGIDNNTTYSIGVANFTPGDSKIRLTAGGTGSGSQDVNLISGEYISLTNNTVENSITISVVGVQPLDSDLTSISGLGDGGTVGLLRKTAANTWNLDNTSYEVTSNKVTFIRPSAGPSETATNDKYPSELAVATRLDNINSLLDDISGGDGGLGSLNERITALESGDIEISGTKTFTNSPVVPDKVTAATNSGTAIATEAQVYNLEQIVNGKEPVIEPSPDAAKYYSGDKTWKTLPAPPGTNLEATRNDTSVTITSSTGSDATISGATDEVAGVVTTGTQTFAGTKTFKTSPIVPSKSSTAGNNSTAIATEAQVYSKEALSNKRTDIRTIDADDTSYVSELGIKTYVEDYVDGRISGVYRPAGNWNATTNDPALANNVSANTGKVYRVTTAGTQFGLTFAVGDKLAFIEGGAATKWDNVDDVTTVAGKTGDVTLADMGLDNVDNTSDLDKPISTATQSALDTKVTSNTAITGAKKTKITYDSKGLVTAGEDLVEDDIPQLPISKITNLQTDLDGKQPLDADLTAIAALTDTSGLLKKTAANIWGLDTTAYEDSANKKTAWGTPTDTDYPSSKLVKDSLDGKEPTIEVSSNTSHYYSGDKTWKTLPDTNLAAIHSDTYVDITSSTGSLATLNGATEELAGVVTTGAQTFAGTKSFSSNLVIPNATANTHALNRQTADGRYSTKTELNNKINYDGNPHNMSVTYNPTTGIMTFNFE